MEAHVLWSGTQVYWVFPMAPLRFGTKRILLVRFSTRPHSCFFPDTQLCHHWRGLSTVERDVIYHRCYLVVFFFIGRFGSGKKGTSRLQFADAPKSNEGRHGTGSFTFFVRCSSFVIFFGYFFFAGSFFASLSFDFVLSSYVFFGVLFFVRISMAVSKSPFYSFPLIVNEILFQRKNRPASTI